MDALESTAERSRERPAGERFRKTGRAFEHDVAAGDRRMQQRFERLRLPDDGLAERCEQTRGR